MASDVQGAIVGLKSAELDRDAIIRARLTRAILGSVAWFAVICFMVLGFMMKAPLIVFLAFVACSTAFYLSAPKPESSPGALAAAN
ncbi:MAG: hypothetical protein PHW63_10780, partial [Alphaproteobacteria bacterium]|nr:hypothetical protein [Alphaproteobacteria bacterium]